MDTMSRILDRHRTHKHKARYDRYQAVAASERAKPDRQDATKGKEDDLKT
jgi:hypothetical protein